MRRARPPFGPPLAILVALASWAAIAAFLPPGGIAASAHNWGLAMTMIFGILAVTWWRQAAVLSNRAIDDGGTSPWLARDSNVLNAAAATATGLGLIASGFISTAWNGNGGRACMGGFVLVLALFGDDLHQAVAISARDHLRIRSMLSLALIVAILLIFALDRTAE